MNAPARIYRFQHAEGEEVVLADVEATCRLLQKELMLLARSGGHPGRGHKSPLHALSLRSGVGDQTIARILYGETTQPRHRTVLCLLDALGFTLIARR